MLLETEVEAEGVRVGTEDCDCVGGCGVLGMRMKGILPCSGWLCWWRGELSAGEAEGGGEAT